MTVYGFDRFCSPAYRLPFSSGRDLPSSPAGPTWTRLSVDPRAPSRLLASIWALMALLAGILGLALLGGLITEILSDRMARHVVLPSESLPLTDGAPDYRPDHPAAITLLPVVNCCLSLVMIIGTLALMHTCLWLIRYLGRPQLLTRL